eukprot:g6475.t1
MTKARICFLLCLIFQTTSSISVDHGSLSKKNLRASDPSNKPVCKVDDDCGGVKQGHCKSGVCECKTGFGGLNCEEPVCPNPLRCGRNGKCRSDDTPKSCTTTCCCNEGWTGSSCDEEKNSCGGEGHGFLLAGKCFCLKGWMGENCMLKACDPVCDATQECMNGKCVSSQAEPVPPPAKLCENNCNSQGKCVDGVCFCKPGYGGLTCDQLVCPGDPQCSGHGACLKGMCYCESGYVGTACDVVGLSSTKDLDKDELTAVIGREIAELSRKEAAKRREIEEFLSNVGSTPASSAHSKLAELKKEAEEISQRLKGLRIELDNTNPLPADPIAESMETRDFNERMAFQLFKEENRKQEMHVLSKNINGDSVEGAESLDNMSIEKRLKEKWDALDENFRKIYGSAAKAAISAEKQSWSLAKSLFISSTLDSNSKMESDESAVDVAKREWEATPTATKMHFFLAARSAADGVQSPDSVSANIVERSRKSVKALEMAVQDLAFKIFTEENWEWAEKQMMKKLKSNSDKQNVARVYPDALQTLSTAFKKLSVPERRKYIDRAETVLASSFFNVAGEGQIGVGTLTPPPARTVVNFQLQLVGLRKAAATTETRALVTLSLNEVLMNEVEPHGLKIVEQKDDPTSDLQPFANFRYAIVLKKKGEKFLQKVQNVLKNAVNGSVGKDGKKIEGSLEKKLHEAGVDGTPVFPIGGEFKVVFDSGENAGSCPNDYKCGANGECQDGFCACKMVSISGKLYQYAGHDCALEPQRMCKNDCNFHGVCLSTGRCECNDGWTGEACENAQCINNCSGHGICHDGVCGCEVGFSGNDCSLHSKQCRNSCSGHGECDTHTGECHCEAGYHGDGCECVDDCIEENSTCTANGCKCLPRWKGANCDIPTCGDPNCSGHGTCTNDNSANAKCKCSNGWFGESCACPSQDKHHACSGHGICEDDPSQDHALGCYCATGWTGQSCALEVCNPPDCSGHGRCNEGKCQCDAGWKDKGCQEKTCKDPTCAGNGKCAGAVCKCDDGWTGETCKWNTSECPEHCNAGTGQGDCIGGACVCKAGWSGASCGIKGCPFVKVMVEGKEERLVCGGKEKGTCSAALPSYGETEVKEFVCDCSEGWGGNDCTTKVPVPHTQPKGSKCQCKRCCLTSCVRQMKTFVQCFMDCKSSCMEGRHKECPEMDLTRVSETVKKAIKCPEDINKVQSK